jgi:hypothetical protein
MKRCKNVAKQSVFAESGPETVKIMRVGLQSPCHLQMVEFTTSPDGVVPAGPGPKSFYFDRICRTLIRGLLLAKLINQAPAMPGFMRTLEFGFGMRGRPGSACFQTSPLSSAT